MDDRVRARQRAAKLEGGWEAKRAEVQERHRREGCAEPELIDGLRFGGPIVVDPKCSHRASAVNEGPTRWVGGSLRVPKPGDLWCRWCLTTIGQRVIPERWRARRWVAEGVTELIPGRALRSTTARDERVGPVKFTLDLREVPTYRRVVASSENYWCGRCHEYFHRWIDEGAPVVPRVEACPVCEGAWRG